MGDAAVTRDPVSPGEPPAEDLEPGVRPTYAALLVDWLVELGYTHCFFVAGGNNMHLLNAVRSRMSWVPFVHEVSAGIAAEYFNEYGGEGRAFAMVTAGPGLTQATTALAGAFLESRELLVIGGQVKSTDLIARSGLRQRGIQEIDGVAIAAPVCVTAERLEAPISRERFVELVESGRAGRPGPVFLEVCLDVQGAPVDRRQHEGKETVRRGRSLPQPRTSDLERLDQLLSEAQRPILLVGGGVSRDTIAAVLPGLRRLGVPLQTTWNAMDRLGPDEPLYVGRPNTWGQRSANLVLQSADLIVALGSRLGLQQTGFNWQGFGPLAQIVQVEVDRAELDKGHPRVDLPVLADANPVLRHLTDHPAGRGWGEWLDFCRLVRAVVPLEEAGLNTPGEGFLSPYRFAATLTELTRPGDIVVPCSSGGANSTMMQAFEPKAGQLVVTDKGLASMGYGLAGAIGAALAHPGRRTILVEGDGGFAQNLQELATAAVNRLPLKVFLFSNEGYASIRSTQRNYFDGAYVGCDVSTGLGFPDWPALFRAFGFPVRELDSTFPDDDAFTELFDARGPAAFVVPIDPEQTYFPKIASRVTETGSMESNPLHHMSPPLPAEVADQVFRFLAPGPLA